jgi:heme oxygenase
MTDILARLRAETCTEHEADEQELGLVDETLTLARYRRRLEQFWGFYAPLGARFETGGGSGGGEAMIGRHRKRVWLETDLRALGVPRPEALPHCRHLPDLPDCAAMLGCSYVLEGATLGGQIISRHLAARLGILAESGGRFFHGYGDRTADMWKTFTAHVRSFDESAGKEDDIVAAAVVTFRSLRSWCGERLVAP